MELIKKEILDGIKKVSERIELSQKEASRPDNLGFDVAYTNLLVTKSNLILALTNLEKVSE